MLVCYHKLCALVVCYHQSAKASPQVIVSADYGWQALEGDPSMDSPFLSLDYTIWFLDLRANGRKYERKYDGRALSWYSR